MLGGWMDGQNEHVKLFKWKLTPFCWAAAVASSRTIEHKAISGHQVGIVLMDICWQALESLAN